jgi:hypothetical protein
MGRWGTCAALGTVGLLAVPAAGGEDARAVLSRVREYVAWYDRQLVTLIADERYVQGNGDSSRRDTHRAGGRRLDSEFGWVAVPAVHDTIGVREVRQVDGRPVAGAYRLRALLERPPDDASREVWAILAESATHNVGNVQRNINFPTFALAYLRNPREHDTKWRAVRSGDQVDLQFEERGRSTLVRTPEGMRTPARGRFSVDAATGRIRACELRVKVRDGRSSRPIVYWMLVDFAPDPRLGVWVPVRMLERHYRDGATRVLEAEMGEATYKNYRRYETRGRLLP